MRHESSAFPHLTTFALNGTVATLNGIEWYCGPLSGVSSGIELLFPGDPLHGRAWYCGPLSGVSSGIEVLFPGI